MNERVQHYYKCSKKPRNTKRNQRKRPVYPDLIVEEIKNLGDVESWHLGKDIAYNFYISSKACKNANFLQKQSKVVLKIKID